MITKNKKLVGFTLVELIIVISILAILSTIAFLSFQGYIKNSRDSTRLASLRNIENGLTIFYEKSQKFPEPDSSIQVQSSGGTIIGYQGYFGDIVSNIIGFSNTPIDPIDNSKFVYSTNISKNKFQLMGFLENSDEIAFITQTYADNSNRFPITRGNNLGIILDSNNNPITTDVDVENYNGPNLKVYLNNNYKLEGTGSVIKGIIATLKDGKNPWGYYDKNCNLPDIVIGNQTWAGCNSTLGKGFERGQEKDDIGTSNYNGTVGSCYKVYNSSVNGTSDCVPGDVSMRSNSNPKDWFSGVNTRGDAEYNTIWGKFYDWDTINENCKGGSLEGNSINNNCPCPTGWHIPSHEEWIELENFLYGSECRDGTGWKCNGLGWKRNGELDTNSIADKLSIPLSGVVTTYNYTYYNRGRTMYFWTTSTVSDKVYYRQFDWDSITVNGDLESYSDYGFNVRCIKD